MMIRRFGKFVVIVLCFSSLSYAEPPDRSDNPLIYNEEALISQLKGKDKEEVLKVLGEPAVKKPTVEGRENLGYWWYNLPDAGIFVYFKDGRVTRISVLTEDKRSKKI